MVSPEEALAGLVEREAEVAAISRALDEAGDGRGRVILVEGPPGVGKSRLIEVARQEASNRGFAVLRAQATELEADFPMGVVLQLFEPHLAQLDESGQEALFSGAAGQARSLFDTAGPVRADLGHGLLHGLYWFTANVVEAMASTRHRGVLISADDVHWADEASLRFLCHLVPRIADLPLAVVLALRDSEHQSRLVGALRSAAQLLKPQPLSSAGVAALVSWAFPNAEEAFRRACGRASQGNPFLLVELLTSLASEHLPPTSATATRLNELVPETVLRSVLTRRAR